MTLDELLAGTSESVAALTRRLVDHVTASADWNDIRVYPGWHGVGFHHGDHGYVVGVFPREDDVRVLFEHGHLLGTAPFVEGRGQTRYISFETWDRARVGAVDDLLDRALSA